MAVALAVKKWTLAELHRLPDDGNKYELVRGQLFVTPPPTDEHETIAARLNEILAPYVREQGLGLVFRPRAVMRFEGSEVEPDLMVRREHPRRTGRDEDWTRAPVPILMVEILSSYTRRRDHREKRQLYLDAGVAEYWVIDPEEREISVSRHDAATHMQRQRVTWLPAGVSGPLSVDVAELF